MGSVRIAGQAALIVFIGVAAGVVHSVLKPIDRSLGGGASASPPPAALTAQGPAGAGGKVDAKTQAPRGTAASPTQPSGPTAPSPAPSTAAKPSADGLIELEAVKALLDAQAADFFDARSESEYAAGTIPGAFHLPPDAFAGGALPEVTNFVARERKIVVFCGGGECDASKLVALRLRGIGFRDVSVFHGGMTEWLAKGMPVTGVQPAGGGK